MMSGYGVHCLIVADVDSRRHTRSWGLVDALDLARAEAEAAATVADVAATEVVTIDSSAPLSAAARRMAEQGAFHLVAIGRNGQAQGRGCPARPGLTAALA